MLQSRVHLSDMFMAMFIYRYLLVKVRFKPLAIITCINCKHTTTFMHAFIHPCIVHSGYFERQNITWVRCISDTITLLCLLSIGNVAYKAATYWAIILRVLFVGERSLHSLTIPVLALPYQLAHDNSGQGSTAGPLPPLTHRGQCTLSCCLWIERLHCCLLLGC